MKPLLTSLTAVLMGVMSVQATDFHIPFEKYKLKNGMNVILSQDNAVPAVTVYVLYGVGARSEEKGRTGFAHLFEHMMFQGSANAPKGVHFKTVESNGGRLNGSTHPDYTDYFEALPSNKLAVGLWLESDRMRGLAINDENLKNQKEAVKEERRLTFDNQPYNTAIIDLWPALAYKNWGNSHSLIGSFEDLNAATVDDVARFFKTYYAPNNATLAIVGDIQIPEAKKLVEYYFGDIAPQDQPPAPNLAEPEQTQPRSQVAKDPLAQVPAVVLGYPGPARRNSDFYALTMLDVVLSGGDSSRFKLNLVKGKKSVVQFDVGLGWPFASYTDYKAPFSYAGFFVHNPNFTGKQIVDQVKEEIEKIRKDGVDINELNRARAYFRSTRLTQLQTSLSRAQVLAQYQMLDGDPDYINTELDKYLSVTPEQIQAVARKYLMPERLSVLEIVPAPAPKKEGE